MMHSKRIITALAIVGVLLTGGSFAMEEKVERIDNGERVPSRSPFAFSIAGAGLIESRSENVEIGSAHPGLVADVFVKPGDTVQQGTPLFSLDPREVDAELAVVEAETALAKAELKDALERYALIAQAPRGAISREERLIRENALAIARAKVKALEASRERVVTIKDRLTVTSPLGGQVLQSNIRKGEFAVDDKPTPPLMVIGDNRVLHVRVDIDENDAWRFDPQAKAVGVLKGNRSLSTPLTFVRVDPFVVPKRSLTGASTERVDTRVLQVLYSFSVEDLPGYVGQQMDVFIEESKSS